MDILKSQDTFNHRILIYPFITSIILRSYLVYLEALLSIVLTRYNIRLIEPYLKIKDKSSYQLIYKL